MAVCRYGWRNAWRDGFGEKMNEKVKRVLYFAAGITIITLGIILRVVLQRRGLSSPIGQPGGDIPSANLAGDANSAAGEAVDNSAKLASDIKRSNSTAQRLVHRGSDLLAKAKHRDGNSGG